MSCCNKIILERWTLLLKISQKILRVYRVSDLSIYTENESFQIYQLFSLHVNCIKILYQNFEATCYCNNKRHPFAPSAPCTSTLNSVSVTLNVCLSYSKYNAFVRVSGNIFLLFKKDVLPLCSFKLKIKSTLFYAPSSFHGNHIIRKNRSRNFRPRNYQFYTKVADRNSSVGNQFENEVIQKLQDARCKRTLSEGTLLHSVSINFNRRIITNDSLAKYSGSLI